MDKARYNLGPNIVSYFYESLHGQPVGLLHNRNQIVWRLLVLHLSIFPGTLRWRNYFRRRDK